MDADGDGAPRRRRRRRATREQGAPRPTGAIAPQPADTAAAPAERSGVKAARRRKARDANPERGLRDIVGAGRSQLGVSGALRARDVNRPGAEELAEAERDVVVVKRNWKPPASGA